MTRAMPSHPSRITFAAALPLCAALLAASAQDMPDRFRAGAAWAAGEKQTYQVQQVVKERAGGKEETRFFSNGTLEITAVESTADTLTFTWHRRMENGELELVREPWGIRGNAPYEKLLSSTVRDGLPLTVKLNLRTQRARIENRDESAETSKDEDERDGEPKSAGLAGGAPLPVAYEARVEMSLPSGWPKRAAILRTEADGASAESKRTTQRRVYLRQ